MAENGMNHLARVLQSRMSATSARPSAIDMATVLPNLDLKTDLNDIYIPAADYVRLQGPDGTQIQPGDRVAILWAEDEVIVLGALEFPGDA